MELIDLTGIWNLSGRGIGESRVLPAEVPGGVHAALMAEGVIPDPGVGDNAEKVAWVGEGDWTFERPFEVSASLLEHDVVELECDGIDTFAEVLINGKTVLRADNMFKSWKIDVRDVLHVGSNSIRVEVESPFRHADKALVRKAKYGFGSEYSPECVTAGICRPLRIRAWNEARFRDVVFKQEHVNGEVNLFIDIWVDSARNSDREIIADYLIEDPSGVEIIRGDLRRSELSGGSFSGKCNIVSPQLWWPNGMGAQPLYSVTLTLRNTAGSELDRVVNKTGLRSLDVVERQDGLAFARCNGREVFLKGGVWIPPGLFPAHFTSEDYIHLVGSAVDAGMNAFKIWDGGTFENDIFWELCDENGMIVFGVDGISEFEDGVGKQNQSFHHACLFDNYMIKLGEDNGLRIIRDEMSFPCPDTLSESLPENRRWINGSDMDDRVSGPRGASAILADIVWEWPVASSFSDWIWLSQIAHGAFVCDEIAKRRLEPSCSGVMWEPFASCWANADGSSIDSAGRWKSLHYMVRAAFAEVSVHGVLIGYGMVDVYISDLEMERRDVLLRWRAMGMNGMVFDEGQIDHQTRGRNSAEPVAIDIASVVEHYGENSVVLWLDVLDAEGDALASDFVLFSPPKHLELENPQVALDIDDTFVVDGEEVFRVTLSAAAPAFWVWLDIPGEQAQFSGNFICLEPDSPVEIYVSTVNSMKQHEFRQRLVVRSLYDIKTAINAS